ncbi:hypothetical protein FALBO_6084 [Fusarium albosuccineum]|uniref:Uncharacterized protein n=1 Tax=Fusarium albosuccineum TaxID=1237068 RepID=A0A8H4LGE5_9HYPO|nr:hypothetical protein FALBO_6084 [Fusarium albosuccineum]KAF5005899.1 hypothetical protein FDECE_7657 [Fusarium decemcellulare]
MCTQTETREECYRCGYVSATQGPIESCPLRARQPFDGHANNPGGRCYGVATTSYTESVICHNCAILEELARGKHEAHHGGDEFGRVGH